MMRQEIGWFDQKENSTGTLTTRLSTEADGVKGLTGTTLGAAMQSISAMTTGFTIAFANNWKMTLVVMSMIPALGVASYLELKSMLG